MHCSPLGPELELDLCKCWYQVDRTNVRSATRKDWAKRLGHTEHTTATRLQQLAAADVGFELDVQDPPRGEKAKLWVVRLTLPPLERMALPRGAKFHALELAEYERFIADASALEKSVERMPPSDAPVGYIDGPDGTMVPAPAPELQDEDLPDELREPSTAVLVKSAALEPDDADDALVPELERGCRTNMAICTDLTTAVFPHLVRAPQVA